MTKEHKKKKKILIHTQELPFNIRGEIDRAGVVCAWVKVTRALLSLQSPLPYRISMRVVGEGCP